MSPMISQKSHMRWSLLGESHLIGRRGKPRL
jgi:hypothetical protein